MEASTRLAMQVQLHRCEWQHPKPGRAEPCYSDQEDQFHPEILDFLGDFFIFYLNKNFVFYI